MGRFISLRAPIEACLFSLRKTLIKSECPRLGIRTLIMNLIKKTMEAGMQWSLEGVLSEISPNLAFKRTSEATTLMNHTDKPAQKKPKGDRFIPLRNKNEDLGRIDVLEQKENHCSNLPGAKIIQPAKQSKVKRRVLQFNGEKNVSTNEEEYIQDMTMKGLLKINRSAKKAVKMTRKAEKVLDAPGLVNDYYLNLIDWGKNNLLAVCLGEGAFVWNPSTQDGHQFFASESSLMIPTAVAWSPYVVPS